MDPTSPVMYPKTIKVVPNFVDMVLDKNNVSLFLCETEPVDYVEHKYTPGYRWTWEHRKHYNPKIIDCSKVMNKASHKDRKIIAEDVGCKEWRQRRFGSLTSAAFYPRRFDSNGSFVNNNNEPYSLELPDESPAFNSLPDSIQSSASSPRSHQNLVNLHSSLNSLMFYISNSPLQIFLEI